MRPTRLVVFMVALAALAGSAEAQYRRRVIQLDDGCHLCPEPNAPIDLVVTAVDPCPGATLLRACGAPSPGSGECPTLGAALAVLGDGGIDRCTPSPALLGVSDALSREAADLERAHRLDVVLARSQQLRDVALFRAGRVAYRLSRYDEAARRWSELLDATDDAALRALGIESLALVVAYSDHDEDMRPDDGYPEARFSTALLPARPWAREVALRGLRWITTSGRGSDARRALVAFRARFPEDAAGELDALEAQVLDAERRRDELVAHLLAAADRCWARGAQCADGFLDRARDVAVEALAHCRSLPGGEITPQGVEACLVGASIAARLQAVRPSDALGLDLADAIAWAARAAVRVHAAVTRRRSRGRFERTDTDRVLALPPPPDPPPIRVPRSAPPPVEGVIDRRAVVRTLELAPLASCMPERALALPLRIRVEQSGVIRTLDAGPGPTATCVRGVVDRLAPLEPGPEGGAATLDAVVMFVR